ncbi:class I SAM-dependent methyltransferase [Acidomonas methanolica]|uniref:class I SAM-dependent methyltransferase n=1 Tax=Acidomonas methanolica TaxID=437 RepID=UPI00211A1750|nr:methyltransferase [Acidomonas methanolica]MCQ9155148.1 class I SAM-dependent methyltransferase [Acidomonas methanolica]
MTPLRALAALFAALLPLAAHAQDTLDALHAAVASPARTPTLAARDAARHPLEELSFFGVKPDSTVVEIWPGSGYWTEILAPYLHDHGTYYVAMGTPDGTPVEREYVGFPAAEQARFDADPARYGHIRRTVLAQGHDEIAPPRSVDVVLTFRNFHNWLTQGDAPEMLAAIHRALKPGGILGIEDHRSHPATPQDPIFRDGYVRQDFAIRMVEKAGFTFVGASEIDANPRDTTYWPKGVWTLPPTYALGDKDRAKYQAIGEADNFVLKFRKN